MSNLYWLTNAQLACLKPFFPKSHGKLQVNDRSAFEEHRRYQSQ